METNPLKPHPAGSAEQIGSDLALFERRDEEAVRPPPRPVMGGSKSRGTSPGASNLLRQPVIDSTPAMQGAAVANGSCDRGCGMAMTEKFAPPEVADCDVVVRVRGQEIVHCCPDYSQALKWARLECKPYLVSELED